MTEYNGLLTLEPRELVFKDVRLKQVVVDVSFTFPRMEQIGLDCRQQTCVETGKKPSQGESRTFDSVFAGILKDSDSEQ